ncbi:hypothetical protein SDC9_145073 [bioreactor metagenome]|uniref:Uncharacterized protein n=1 Tax=bioreactor metagenome TaxID=1076179 RepID=A0A645EAP3_9ZZZZ
MLAVVLLDDVLHRRDAGEVVSLDPDRTHRHQVGLGAGDLLDRGEGRAEQVGVPDAQPVAGPVDQVAQVRVHQGGDDDPGGRTTLEALHDRDDALDGADPRVADDPEASGRELGLRRAGKASRRLPGGVGNDMDLKDFARHDQHISARPRATCRDSRPHERPPSALPMSAPPDRPPGPAARPAPAAPCGSDRSGYRPPGTRLAPCTPRTPSTS